MKIKIISTANSPSHYSFNGDTIAAHQGGMSESLDLSTIQTGDKFQGVTVDTLDIAPPHIIRDAYRDGTGELHVTICQAVGPGDWGESQEFDATDYDPDAIHVEFKGAIAGTPWALTRRGKVNPETGEVI